jgi:16S rRNA (guanine527-N7)-methyltransferase
MKFDFRSRLTEGLDILEIDIPEDSYGRLELYFTELKKWSQKVNLIAKRATDEQIIENHFLDSLMILPLLEESGTHLLDVGTGAGFPGLICKAARPEIDVTLVEPRLKRVSFLKQVVRILDLQGVNTLACRIEDESTLSSTEKFSHITCRAVTDLGVFLEMVERFSPSAGQVICMKGPKWQEELDEAAEIIKQSYVLQQVVKLQLPFSNAPRNVLLFEYNKSQI